jgi:hypothetical protein
MAKRRRERVVAADRVEPTPETAAKLRPDALEVWNRIGRLTDDDVDAAIELRGCYLAVCAQLMWKERGDVQTSGGSRYEISDWHAAQHAQVYVPWAARWGPVVARVHDLALDGVEPAGVWQAVRQAIRDYGKALRSFRAGFRAEK